MKESGKFNHGARRPPPNLTPDRALSEARLEPYKEVLLSLRTWNSFLLSSLSPCLLLSPPLSHSLSYCPRTPSLILSSSPSFLCLSSSPPLLSHRHPPRRDEWRKSDPRAPTASVVSSICRTTSNEPKASPPSLQRTLSQVPTCSFADASLSNLVNGRTATR